MGLDKKILTVIALLAVSVLTWAATDRQLDAVTITNDGVVITLPTSAGTLVDEDGTATLTNKSMSGASNTFTLIDLTSSVTGALPIANGGTGQTTAQTAIDALLPSQAAANGLFLTSDGTNSSWAAAGGSFADLQLSNLTGTTAVPVNLMPSTNRTLDLGGNANRWDVVKAAELNISSGSTTNATVLNFTMSNGDNFLEIQGKSSAKMPSGSQVLMAFGTDNVGPSASTTDMGFYSGNYTSTGAIDTGDYLFETGNITNVSATGVTGSFVFRPGTNAGAGARGAIVFTDGSEGTDGHIWTQNGTTGIGNWEAAPMASPDIGGTRAAPTAITAAGGITAGSGFVQIQFVEGSAGPIDITVDPQISAGTSVGETMTLVGRNGTNTLTLDDGTGLSLNGTAVLGADDVITLMWDSVNWVEVSRR